MLAKWDPFRDLLSVEDEFERLLGRPSARMAWAPALDVRETEDRFEVTVDLPGMESDDVTVTFESGVLTVSGKREFSSEQKDETFHRIERSYGSFARSIRLPHVADPERIDASFDKGVLSVRVPKVEAAKPRTIEVKTS
ncbi:MAG TPA: Hsp20/alpha crystallin family protein [Actinomycetota bacterium]|nr:Hsp20/alpha crystallin family protein [Actinomycetota bacterium]